MKALFFLIFATLITTSIQAKSMDHLNSEKEFTNSKEMISSNPARFALIDQEKVESCFDTACSYLGNWSCTRPREITEIRRVCRGNPNGDCVDAVCEKLDRYACAKPYHIKDIIRSCQGNYNGDCVRETCDRLPWYKCNDRRELTQIANDCGW